MARSSPHALDVPAPAVISMDRYSRAHVPSDVLVRNLKTRVANQNSELADLLADIGEYDARRLYSPAGYDSTYRFCVRELHLAEQAAFKRIYVAKLARRFPVIFEMIADGRLHLSGLVVLRRYFTRRNTAELLAAATHKTVSEIRLFKRDGFRRATCRLGSRRSRPFRLLRLPSGPDRRRQKNFLRRK